MSETKRGGVFTPKVARPEWVQPSIADVIRSLELVRNGTIPEVLHGAFLRTSALRLLRCVYGSDESTVAEVTRFFRERTNELANAEITEAMKQ